MLYELQKKNINIVQINDNIQVVWGYQWYLPLSYYFTQKNLKR